MKSADNCPITVSTVNRHAQKPPSVLDEGLGGNQALHGDLNMYDIILLFLAGLLAGSRNALAGRRVVRIPACADIGRGAVGCRKRHKHLALFPAEWRARGLP